MSSPVNLGKKKSVPRTPEIPRDDDSDQSLPRDMLVERAIAKESPSNFKTPDRSPQNMPATENSPLDSRGSGSFTPKTPAAPLRDHGPFTRRSNSDKVQPRKALFQGSSCESSSNYKTPVPSQQKICMSGPMTAPAKEHTPLDSTRSDDEKVNTTRSTHPQEAPKKSRRPRSHLLNNPEMTLHPRSLFPEPALPRESSDPEGVSRVTHGRN